MRRKDHMMDEMGIKRVLGKGEYGFLGTVGDGNPYITPLSYVVMDDDIYFHAALKGKKLDNIKENPNVTFCVVGKTQPVFLNNYTTYFESVMAFGRAEEVTDEKLKYKMLYQLVEKYLPDHMDEIDKQINGSMKATAIYRIKIKELTGKEKKRIKYFDKKD